MSASTCQYGVLGVVCGLPASTERQRPGGPNLPATATWDVCEWHARILDRIRDSIRDHAALLDALEKNEWAPVRSEATTEGGDG